MSRSGSTGTEPAATLAAAVADARFIFVAGKGGVGKTTAAAALALELAGRGPVHLISTDPAHSVADVFGVAGLGAPVASPCTPSLLLEELDAEAAARRWLGHAGGSIASIIERGTYLDAEDVTGFTELALPGVDEVMALLRLVELEGQAGRVVVDTAPTGHTLRLLDAPATHESLARALRAMADKAAVVASSLTRRSVRLAGESIIDELEARVRVFRDRVLGRAAFVIATQPTEGVSAETLRLARALRDRRLHIAAMIVRGAGPEPAASPGDEAAAGDPAAAAGRDSPDQRSPGYDGVGPCFRVQDLGSPTGCDGLRAWYAALEACAPQSAGYVQRATVPTTAARGIAEDAADVTAAPGSAADWLAGLRLRLLVFAGKGGTGKTTCAAATALLLAGTRDVLLCSADPAGSLDDVFGREVVAVGMAAPRLRVAQVAGDAVLARARERYRDDALEALGRLGLTEAVALDRRVVEAVLELAPPGIDELAALSTLLGAAASHETIVLDAAPTGHFLRLLTMPELALDWTRQLMRVMVKYGAGTGGAGEALLRTARELRALQELLRDPGRTGVFIVSLDEAVVRAETGRLRAALAGSGVPVAAQITNRVAPRGETQWPAGSAARDAALASGRPAHPDPAGAVELIAPLAATPPIGEAALRSFVEKWSMVA